MIHFHFKLDSHRDTILREDKNRQVYESLRAGCGEHGKAAGLQFCIRPLGLGGLWGALRYSNLRTGLRVLRPDIQRLDASAPSWEGCPLLGLLGNSPAGHHITRLCDPRLRVFIPLPFSSL